MRRRGARSRRRRPQSGVPVGVLACIAGGLFLCLCMAITSGPSAPPTATERPAQIVSRPQASAARTESRNAPRLQPSQPQVKRLVTTPIEPTGGATAPPRRAELESPMTMPVAQARPVAETVAKAYPTVERTEIDLDTTMFGRGKLQAYVAVQVRSDRRVPFGDNASDIVCVFPYPDQPRAADEYVSYFCQLHGYTVVTINFTESVKIDANGKPLSIQGDYYFPSSGSGPAWLEALAKVRKKFALESRKVFAFGLSGGGSAAHQFAEAYPDQVEAYASEAGRNFVKNPVFPGPTLFTRGEYDYVRLSAEPFERALDEGFQRHRLPYESLVVTYRPDWKTRAAGSTIFQHCGPAPAKDLMREWIVGLIKLRSGNHGGVPPSVSWPSAIAKSVLEGSATARGSAASGGADAKHVAGVRGPSARASVKLADDDAVRIPLPSEACAALIQALPPRVVSGTLPGSSYAVCWSSEPDSAGRPALVFVDHSDHAFTAITHATSPNVERHLRLLVQQASDRGFSAIAIDAGEASHLGAVKSFVSDWVRAKSSVRAVTFFGFCPGDEIVASNLGQSSTKLIVVDADATLLNRLQTTHAVQARTWTSLATSEAREQVEGRGGHPTTDVIEATSLEVFYSQMVSIH